MDKIDRLLEEVFAAGSDFATGVNGGGDRQSFQNYANAAIAKARAEFTRLENVNYTWSQRFVTLIKENETLKAELAVSKQTYNDLYELYDNAQETANKNYLLYLEAKDKSGRKPLSKKQKRKKELLMSLQAIRDIEEHVRKYEKEVAEGKRPPLQWGLRCYEC